MRSGRIGSKPLDAPHAWIHDFGLELADDVEFDIDRVKDAVRERVRAASGPARVENDDFNRLVLRAQLGAREVTILRAYAKYLRQVGSTFSDAYIERALTGNPAIARKLARTVPRALRSGARTMARCVQAHVERVLDGDRSRARQGAESRRRPHPAAVPRRHQRDACAPITTDWSSDGQPKPYLSFKFDPAQVPGLPEPKPMFEIWVYSPRVEGVHLRGGRVARGGLRWSDRREDFRTEVLGLMKAQMVKNVGDRAGRIEGRLRREESAAARAIARRGCAKASPAIRRSCAACSM